MPITVYGSIAYDRIMDFNDIFKNHILPDKLHQLNVSFTVNEYKETFGGTAGNIAYNLALLNERPKLYGSVGNDFGAYAKRLKKLKIDTSGVKIHKNILTASANIITDKKNNQITGFFPGALIYKGKLPLIDKNNFAIIAPGNSDEMLSLSWHFYKHKAPFIFDPGQQIIRFTKNQLKKAIDQSSIYIVNDYELALTKKIAGLSEAAILKNAGVLITTLGEKGSLINLKMGDKVKRYKIKAVKSSKIADPTGAGDAYRAGLLKGLKMFKAKASNLTYLPWPTIGQTASLAGVYAAEKYGTQNHSYSFKQFKERYYKEFKTKF